MRKGIGIGYFRIILSNANLKGEMKGYTITEQFTKECTELFTRIAFNTNTNSN